MSMTLTDLETLVRKQTERIDKLERLTLPMIPMGPLEPSREQELEKDKTLIKLAADIKQKIEEAKSPPPPTDFSARVLADGSPVPEDESHKELKDNGQQKDYVVLSAAERAKGFVRPFRDAYRHLKCGKITTMSRAIAETYAREPHFYTGTFCTTCAAHFPVGEDGEFVWYEMDGKTGPKVGV